MKKSVFALSMAIVVGFVAAVALCIRALNTAQAVSAFDDATMRIVIDAGHGGIDGGVVGRATGVKESDLNLAIAYRLNDVLTDMGFEVILTRKTQAGLYDTTARGFKKRDMQRRKEIIQKANPALVISIHQNYYPSHSSRGAQVFYSTEKDNAKAFALAMQSALNEVYADEGVKARKASSGDYFILKCEDCPSVIAECGFLSNAKDEALLRSEVFQRKLAEAIAAGVIGYLSGSHLGA